MAPKDPSKLHPNLNWIGNRKGGSGTPPQRRTTRSSRSSAMPSLTLDTSPTAQRGNSDSNSQSETNSRSISPGPGPGRPPPPPFSPITPTLSGARLASSSTSNGNSGPPALTTTYTHLQQTAQVGIPQPPLISVDFDTNPDVLALKSAIAVLLNQAKTAKNDIATLERIKSRALDDPDAFLQALGSGEIKTRSDPLFNPGHEDENDDNDSESIEEKRAGGVVSRTWDALPTPQTVVRTPPINWAQYGIVGESLDKMHADQVARPSEGMPARIGADGQVLQGGEGIRRQDGLGVAAPYNPGRDKIEKMSTRKGGKR